MRNLSVLATTATCALLLAGCSAFVPRVPEYTGTGPAPQVHGAQKVPLIPSWLITFSRIAGAHALEPRNFETLAVLASGASEWTMRIPTPGQITRCGVDPDMFRQGFQAAKDEWTSLFERQAAWMDDALGVRKVHYTSYVVPGNCAMTHVFLLRHQRPDEMAMTFSLPVADAGTAAWEQSAFDALSNFSHEGYHAHGYRQHTIGNPLPVEEARAYLFQRCAELEIGHVVRSPWAYLDVDEEWYRERQNMPLAKIIDITEENHTSIQGMVIAQVLTWRWVGEGEITPDSERARELIGHCRNLRQQVPDVIILQH